MIGHKIAHFHILEQLGTGGMGTVYKAKDVNLKRFVAIKVLNSHLLKNDNNYKRFRNEAEVSAQINHPNVATLYDFLEIEDKGYIVMEYVDGVTLEDHMESNGPLTIKESYDIIHQILNGLSEAHQKGIFHRDLKPANIMISRNGYVKIMDFGIALTENSTRLTTHNKVIGTLNYMAPELLTGSVPSPASDIYAVGVILYEMLSAEYMFRAESEAALMYKIVHEPPVIKLSPSKRKLKNTISKMLLKSPSRRYSNATTVMNDLTRTVDQADKKERYFHPWWSSIYHRITPLIQMNKIGLANSFKKKNIVIGFALSAVLLLIISMTMKIEGPSIEPKDAMVANTENQKLETVKEGLPREAYQFKKELPQDVELESEEISEIDKPKATPTSKKKEKSGQPTAPIFNDETEKNSSPSDKLSKLIDDTVIENKIESGNIKYSEITASEEPVPPAIEEPAEGNESRLDTNEEIAEEPSSTPKRNSSTLHRISKNIILRQQKISLRFNNSVSSEDYELGDMVHLVSNQNVKVEGVNVIVEGAPVRAKVVRKKESSQGKLKFGIEILDVQAMNGEWIKLKYPEYSDIQNSKIVWEKDRLINKVTLTSKKLVLKI